MGVRHICLMCVLLWTVFSQLYSAPVSRRGAMTLTDVTKLKRSDNVRHRDSAIWFPWQQGHKGREAPVMRPMRSVGESSPRRNSAIMFPDDEQDVTTTESSLGDRTIFQHRCAAGYASLGQGRGCRRVADSFTRSFNPILLGF